MISIIIPVYNGEKYLDECLSSITDTCCHIIVVNDGSTDKTQQIASKHTQNIINTAHKGPVHARNAGLQVAQTEYLMFLDADDILVENAIPVLLGNIADNDMVIGLRQDFISPEYTNATATTKKSSHGVIAGCAIIKKALFDSIGAFDTDLLCGDGYDWLLRAEKFGAKIKKIEDVLCLRRIHETNMGKTLKDQEYKDYCKIIRKHMIKK